MKSLECLRPLGMMVLFGQSSGAVDPISPSVLQDKGSLFLTRPTLMTYTAHRKDLEACAGELLELIAKDVVKPDIRQEFPLREAAAAHIALESRSTQGATLLIP